MKKLLLLLLLLLLVPISANSEVYWSDDFGGYTSGWTPSVGGTGARLYPWTIDETYDSTDPNDSTTGSVITDYEPSTFSAGQRTNVNSWNGWVQDPAGTGTISIESTGGVDNSPVLRLRLIKSEGLSSELGLHKWLGNTNYQELYIQYKMKFGSTGEDYWWGGGWSGGDPTGGNIIWKFGRVWTGFNPNDYDKTGGQTQPVENTTWTDESNWRSGIWIFRWMATDWNSVDNSVFFDIANFYSDLACTPPSPSCDSQSPSRDPLTGNIWDWANTTTSNGRVNVFANSGNDFDSDGSFSEAQTYHTVEMYFKNRSAPATDDGNLRIWIDGVEITSEADVSPPVLASFSGDADDYGMNFVRFGDNYNNLTELIPDNPGYMDVYIDDIVIASEYIGSGLTTVTLPANKTATSPASYQGTAQAPDGETILTVVSSNVYTVTIDSGAGTQNVAFTVTGVLPTVTDVITATSSDASTGFDSITITLSTPTTTGGIRGGVVRANFR